MPVFNQSRSNIVRLIFSGMFLIIAAQLFHLQIISKTYKQQAQENLAHLANAVVHGHA